MHTEMITGYFDGQLDTAEHDALCALLAGDPSSCDQFVRAARLDAMLWQQYSERNKRRQIEDLVFMANSAAASEVAPAEYRLSEPAYQRAAWWLRETFHNTITVSMILSGLFITTILLSLALWIIPAVAPTTPEDVAVARPTFVALLAGAYDATWAEATAEELAEGRDLYVGQKLELIAGSAEIRYDSGVRVRLFGPAEWTMPSAEGLQLKRGQAVARVNPSAVGFTVGTPFCEVVDLGTEFAVGCDPEGDVNVYVHQGEVEVAPRKPGQNKVRLTAGESINISRNGTARIAGGKKLEELKELAVAAGVTNNMETWSTHRDELKRDNSLAAYFDFQRDPEYPRKLLNLVAAEGNTLHAELGSADNEASRPTWSEGRWKGKQALSFNNAKQQFARVAPQEPIDWSKGISIAVWIRFDAPVGQPAVLLAQRDGAQPSVFQMAVMPPSSRGSMTGIQLLGSPRVAGGYSGAPIDYGTDWQLLTVASNEQQTLFYRNGHEIGRTDGVSLESSAAPLSIGAIFVRDHVHPTFPLSGEIDELLIYRRPLSDAEVLKLYQVGRP